MKLVYVASCCFFAFAASLRGEEVEPIQVVLQEKSPRIYEGNLHVGSLERSEERHLELRLINPKGNGNITLGHPTGSCGCIEISVSDTEIPAGSDIEATLKLRVDATGNAPQWKQFVSFDPDANGLGSVVKIIISSDISGLLAFDKEDFVIQVADTKGKRGPNGEHPGHAIHRELGFVATAPVTISSLIVRVQAERIKCEAVIRQAGSSRGVVELKIDPATIPDEGERFAVFIEDEMHVNRAAAFGSIVRQKPISVLPKNLRFTATGGESLEANALIVRLFAGDEDPTAERKGARSTPPTVDASIGGGKAKVTVLSCNESVCRVRVRVTKSHMERAMEHLHEAAKHQVAWNISWHDMIERPKSDITLVYQ